MYESLFYYSKERLFKSTILEYCLLKIKFGEVICNEVKMGNFSAFS